MNFSKAAVDIVLIFEFTAKAQNLAAKLRRGKREGKERGERERRKREEKERGEREGGKEEERERGGKSEENRRVVNRRETGGRVEWGSGKERAWSV